MLKTWFHNNVTIKAGKLKPLLIGYNLLFLIASFQLSNAPLGNEKNVPIFQKYASQSWGKFCSLSCQLSP